MKYVLGFCLLFTLQFGTAQVKGNQKIITKNYAVEGLTNIQVHLYAKIEIDAAAEEGMTITADANLLDLIDTEIVHGRLVLGQKKWIQPSQGIVIKIGAPALEQIQQSTHETTFVKNINRKSFRAMALVGEISLEGSVQELRASGEVGVVDATKMQAAVVDVNLWSWGKIKLATPEAITGIVENGGTVFYESDATQVKVRKSNDGKVLNPSQQVAMKDPSAVFIDVKIKNNSPNRIQAYVVGPKPDGRKFSYGFPINPGQVKKEKWSVGTKVYRVSKIGTKKKLIEITKADEGKVVSLYAKAE